MPYRGYGASIYFRILCEITIKRKCVIRLPRSVAQNEECIKVNSCTRFVVNLMNI